jgi:hypothetical protein
MLEDKRFVVKINASETVQMDWQELTRRVAERVWELWREDLRRERERRGAGRGRA